MGVSCIRVVASVSGGLNQKVNVPKGNGKENEGNNMSDELVEEKKESLPKSPKLGWISAEPPLKESPEDASGESAKLTEAVDSEDGALNQKVNEE